jgi:hypothetical protein
MRIGPEAREIGAISVGIVVVLVLVSATAS